MKNKRRFFIVLAVIAMVAIVVIILLIKFNLFEFDKVNTCIWDTNGTNYYYFTGDPPTTMNRIDVGSDMYDACKRIRRYTLNSGLGQEKIVSKKEFFLEIDKVNKGCGGCVQKSWWRNN